MSYSAKNLAASMAAAFLLSLISGMAVAQDANRSADGVWSLKTKDELFISRASDREWIQPEKAQGVELDPASLEAILTRAPHEQTMGMWRESPVVLSLPRPDGTFERFAIAYSPVYEEGLRETMQSLGYDMRTFAGISIDDPLNSVRLDFGGPQGFHASIRGLDGVYFIDPYWAGDTTLYSSYFKHENSPVNPGWECLMPDDYELPEHLKEMNWKEYLANEEAGRGGAWNLRTFRIAISATGEYTTFHSSPNPSNAAAGQAAIVTSVNRFNQVYERDVSVRFLLIANNINVVYTSGASDPYSGSENTMMNTCRDTLIAQFTNGGFDIGHLYRQGSLGGIAGAIGNACVDTVSAAHKGRGTTSLPSPVGDPWDIDFVAHELGHQMGAQHTWNHCGGGSGHGLAVEPGSGITVMGYAGLCDSSDLASNSIDIFHGRSIQEINAYVTNGGVTCEGNVATANNNAPTVSAGSNYTIPARTPFELTAATFEDLDGDNITFAWEQNDGVTSGQVSPSAAVTSTTNTLFRPRHPETTPTRTFPRLQNLLAGGTMPLGERLTEVTRTMTFRSFVRDNNAQGGRWGFATMTLNTVNTGSAFAVTAPNGGGTVAGAINVTWNVAGTTANGINAANVDIFLSQDGGLTFPHVLATAVPNSGSAGVVLPNITTSTGRIKVRGSGNIFFDISDTNFSVIPGVPTPQFVLDPPATFSDAAGNNNGVMEPGETITITVPVMNTGDLAATVVTSTLSSMTGTVTVSMAVSTYPDIAIAATEVNDTPFQIVIDPSHECGAPVNLSLAITSSETGFTNIPLSFSTGTPGPLDVIVDENFDAMEALPAGWTVSGSGGADRWAVRTDAASTGTAASAPNLLSFEPGHTVASDRRVITPPLMNPTQLTFSHMYRIEQENGTSAYDSALIEVSTSPTGPWTQLTSQITTGGYTHTANGGFSSPISAGTPCWSGTVGTMTNVVVDLSAWQNETIYVAFRNCADGTVTVTNSGWFIDNVSVIGQTIECDPVVPMTPSPSATASPSPTAPATASPSLTASPSATPTSSPTTSPTVSPTVSASPTASATPSPSLTASPSPTATAEPTASATATATAEPTATASPTAEPTSSPSPSPEPTVGPTASATPSQTIAPTASPSPSATEEPTQTATPSPTEEPTASPSPSATAAPGNAIDVLLGLSSSADSADHNGDGVTDAADILLQP